MKKLVSSSEAAQLLGLSLQGIHYRIKKGQLESVKKDGKTFVYIDQDQTNNISKPKNIVYQNNMDQLLKAKDDQIDFLKKSIKFIKRQYNSEIQRLEKNQNKILKVFQSEVDLLKSAFNEMRSVYKIEHKQKQADQYKQTTELKKTDNTVKFMDIKDFYNFMKRYNKTDSQIKSIILEKIRQKDERFIYNKNTKEVIICKGNFLDLI